MQNDIISVSLTRSTS